MNRKDIQDEIKRTINMEAESIRTLVDILDMSVLSDVVEKLAGCEGKIVMTGCGTSAMAAKKITHSLNCIGRPACFLTPSDAIHGGLGVLRQSDILILISKGGGTSELLPLLEAAKTKGVHTISVTENKESVLGRDADQCVFVKVKEEPCRFNMLATASTLAVISAFDAICIALMQYTEYPKADFAVNHPGGRVGERLLNDRD